MRLGRRPYAPDLETALYRIVQEAVNNAVRHSGAARRRSAVPRATASARARPRRRSRLRPVRARDGFGIIGMRERVALLRGDLEVASSPDGTTVTAAIPITA